MTELELLNYDIEGAAKDANGVVVDGHALTIRTKRIDSPNGHGPELPLYKTLSSLPAQDKADLLAAYHALETIIMGIALEEYAAKAASPDALDETIARARVAEEQAEAADRARAQSETAAEAAEAARLAAVQAQEAAELARDLAEVERLQKELAAAALDEAIAAKQAAIDALPNPETTPPSPPIEVPSG